MSKNQVRYFLSREIRDNYFKIVYVLDKKNYAVLSFFACEGIVHHASYQIRNDPFIIINILQKRIFDNTTLRRAKKKDISIYEMTFIKYLESIKNH